MKNQNIVFQTQAKLLNIQSVYFTLMNVLLFYVVFNSDVSDSFKMYSPIVWNTALISLASRSTYHFQLFEEKLIVKNYLLLWYERELLLDQIHLIDRKHAHYLGMYLEIYCNKDRLIYGCSITNKEQIIELISKIRGPKLRKLYARLNNEELS